MPPIDDALLDTLTPEEREAIASEPDDPDEKQAIETADDEASEAESAVEQTKPQDDAPATDDDDEPQDDEPAYVTPRYEASLPVDFDEQVMAIKQEADSLAKAFKDGEIDFDEYQARTAQLSEHREALSLARIKAEISNEMKTQTAEQEWRNTVETFTRQVAGEVDYRTDLAKQRDLDFFIRALANDASNDNRPMVWFMDEAHRRVKVLHGLSGLSTREQQTAKRKPPVQDLPRTLADVPGSDGPGDVAGEFADIDRLDGFELEAALAKMSPAQREKYERGI